jgi:hypothetical protein
LEEEKNSELTNELKEELKEELKTELVNELKLHHYRGKKKVYKILSATVILIFVFAIGFVAGHFGEHHKEFRHAYHEGFHGKQENFQNYKKESHDKTEMDSNNQTQSQKQEN